MPMRTSAKQPKTVYVALSGGVDSSVAALLLKRAGWHVIGVFMKPWQPASVTCMWQAERADALRVASSLDIPLKTWDFSRQYAALVARPMVKAYRDGITPNPDVECNRHIKFGLFYARAMKEGADAVATGHYARIRASQSDGLQIIAAKDTSKDQTYFLWGLRQRQLARILFPIGGMRKHDVRALASRAGLITATKKDSQGVCFVGDLDMKAYLQTVIKPKAGPIVHVDGRSMGTHDGAGYYTIGQRHGLNITVGGGPYYIVGKNMRRNIIVVGSESDLFSCRSRVKRIHWIGAKPAAGTKLSVKVRYRSSPIPAELHGSTLTFKKPVRAIAPGQSVVFYSGSRMLGGAFFA
jgi:tRNA-specific 2-thiouridylase